MSIAIKIVIVAFCLSVWALCIPACPAESAFDTGVRLYNQGDFRDAAPFFEKATGTAQAAAAYYYQALCQQRLGDVTKARQLYGFVFQRFPGTQEATLSATGLKQLDPNWNGLPSSYPVSALKSQAQGSTQRQAQPAALPPNAIVLDGPKILPDDTKVPFRRSRDNHILVDAQVNGRSAAWIFDTGAEVCSISRRQLQQLGVPLPASGIRVQNSGIGGSAQATVAPLTIQAGDITRTVAVLIQDTDIPPLIGQNFFKGYVFEIDTAGGFLHFIKKGAASAPYGSMAVAYTPVGAEMVVMAEIDGRKCPMIFDTGSYSISFSEAQFRQLGLLLPPSGKPVVNAGVGGTASGISFRVERIDLGPISKTNVPVDVVNPGASMPLLGQTFFCDRRFTIDPEEHTINFWH